MQVHLDIHHISCQTKITDISDGNSLGATSEACTNSGETWMAFSESLTVCSSSEGHCMAIERVDGLLGKPKFCRCLICSGRALLDETDLDVFLDSGEVEAEFEALAE